MHAQLPGVQPFRVQAPGLVRLKQPRQIAPGPPPVFTCCQAQSPSAAQRLSPTWPPMPPVPPTPPLPWLGLEQATNASAVTIIPKTDVLMFPLRAPAKIAKTPLQCAEN